MMHTLRLENIRKDFDGRPTIENISIVLHAGEIVSILGKSGVGKTTLFHCIAGLYQPEEGDILLDGQSIKGEVGHISYMLQKDLLLRYKSVLDNICLPLLLKGKSKKEARTEAQSYFADFGLLGTEHKYPAQLSGGMRQRAALLRTYLFSQDIVLLDEPFSALDAITKEELHRWYVAIAEKMHLSTLLITHDIDEAIGLSDRIYLLAGQPGSIAEELVIDRQGMDRSRFVLSEAFLSYKSHMNQQLL